MANSTDFPAGTPVKYVGNNDGRAMQHEAVGQIGTVHYSSAYGSDSVEVRWDSTGTNYSATPYVWNLEKIVPAAGEPNSNPKVKVGDRVVADKVPYVSRLDGKSGKVLSYIAAAGNDGRDYIRVQFDNDGAYNVFGWHLETDPLDPKNIVRTVKAVAQASKGQYGFCDNVDAVAKELLTRLGLDPDMPLYDSREVTFTVDVAVTVTDNGMVLNEADVRKAIEDRAQTIVDGIRGRIYPAVGSTGKSSATISNVKLTEK